MKAGYVYVLHFSSPYHHARHYIGYAESKVRLYEHVLGKYKSREPRLLKAARAFGIDFLIAASFPGDRDFERRIKNQGHSERFCPICKLERNGQKAKADACLREAIQHTNLVKKKAQIYFGK